jgi:hypothetical protein
MPLLPAATACKFTIIFTAVCTLFLLTLLLPGVTTTPAQLLWHGAAAATFYHVIPTVVPVIC